MQPDIRNPIPQGMGRFNEQSFEDIVKTLTNAQKRRHIEYCLDEFDAAVEGVRHAKGGDASLLKEAKAWGERQKKFLKLLGHRKHMPVIGGKRIKPGSVKEPEKTDDQNY